MRAASARWALALALTSAGAGCYLFTPSRGSSGDADRPRAVKAADVAVPDGYAVEVVAQGLTWPTGIAFDATGRAHVVESGYAYGESFLAPRLLRLEANGRHTVVAEGGNAPWTGVAFHGGAFFVAEGGAAQSGRVLRLTADGERRVLLDGLPTQGDHHTNGPVVGSDGSVYVAVGTVTNAGVVGDDNAAAGWLARHPSLHDVPCRDVTLAGHNFTAGSPTHETGAFLPAGTPSTPRQVVRGQVPCSGAILRVPPAGGGPELVAWGFRNPFGLTLGPDDTVYVTENGYDDRGSRPVWGAPDVLWRVEPGRWYGWPDFAAGRPLSQPRFRPPTGPQPGPLLARAPETPPQPIALLAVHASANGLDWSRSEAFGYPGEFFVAQFGDLTPATGKTMAPVGFDVVRVRPQDGAVREFAKNRGTGSGPASRLGSGGLERPIAVRFDPGGAALWVVDFGVLEVSGDGRMRPAPGTGVVWRITRAAQAADAPPAEKKKWRRPESTGPRSARMAVKRGERIFVRECHHCHPGGRAGLGPALDDRPLPAAAIRVQVRQGLGAMPGFDEEQISPIALEDLVSYVESLRRTDDRGTP